MLSRDWSTTVWPTWLAAVLASFGLLEVVAYRTDRKTLSRALQRWLGVHPRNRLAPAGVLGFGAFWLWLSVHVVTLRPIPTTHDLTPGGTA